ncbi:hypothetical protein FKM82_011400 [Ascaphus truei]
MNTLISVSMEGRGQIKFCSVFKPGSHMAPRLFSICCGESTAVNKEFTGTIVGSWDLVLVQRELKSSNAVCGKYKPTDYGEYYQGTSTACKSKALLMYPQPQH